MTAENPEQQRKLRDLESLRQSKAFCIKPWVHLFISQYGTVAPCCLTPWDKERALGDVNEQSIAEIWNGEPIREFRKKMLADEQDSRCWQCYENEKVGLHSARNITNLLYADKLDWALNTRADGFSADAKPVYWDIRISNLCNFKCRICGHLSSSQWYDDAKALGLLSHDIKLHRGPKDFDRLMEQLDFVIPDLEEIYFAGGEPLIMEEHYRILQTLVERKKTDVLLRYATNFSQTSYKGVDAFDLWRQFDEVHIHASLDGMGERGELQRYGQSWEQAVANRKRMLEICPRVIFSVAATISVFNVLHLPDLHRQWTEQGLMQIDEFIPHLLKEPVEYSICILPQEVKRQVEEKYRNHIEWMKAYAKEHPPKMRPSKQYEKAKDRLDWMKVQLTDDLKLHFVMNELQSFITYMNSRDDSHLIPQFKQKCADIDRLRGENTLETFPELAPLLV